MAFTLKKRRRALRAPLTRPVRVRQGEAERSGRGIEVGVGGMSLWVHPAPTAGQVITLVFSLPNSLRPITAMAEVVWATPAAGERKSGRMGVRFVALPREDREEIRAYVNRLAKHYRDLHILLAMNQWKMDQIRDLTTRAHLDGYRDIKDLKDKVRRAMDGFRL